MQPARAALEVEAELSAPSALVQRVRYHFLEPPASVLRVEDKIRVELCLNSRHRSAQACFVDRWNPGHFERIGELFVLPPTIDMAARSDEDRTLSSVICLLEVPPVLALFDRLPDITDRFLLIGLDIRDANVRYLMLRLADEVQNPGFASQILVESIAAQMGVDLLRYGAALPERPIQGSLAPWQLRRIEERLAEVRESPSLLELAQLCGISVRQLTRSFRAARGCSVGAYVAGRQITHAMRLLAADESVASIATTLGFSSSSNFCSAFRRAAGITPGQYRHSLSTRRMSAAAVLGNRAIPIR
ncbi:MAG: AraC family transcriptional regulator [Hydrocarboniphaga sp.]|uniref:helix-turn-helix transcriptional regulator n=1 Tax=Hydrocarboniphaga sp. TaxID=2033016 RepID=UPI00261D3084|nr:AraC family transcriptional regulator [Hydrocarboniphaga sp.]MDB5973117.1 AraC family transcriptional regulator [Hydrocarboniphaga sp.]